MTPLLERPTDIQVGGSPEWARAVYDVIAASASAHLRLILTSNPLSSEPIPYSDIVANVAETLFQAHQGFNEAAVDHGSNCICRHEAIIAAVGARYCRSQTEFDKVVGQGVTQLKRYLSNRS